MLLGLAAPSAYGALITSARATCPGLDAVVDATFATCSLANNSAFAQVNGFILSSSASKFSGLGTAASASASAMIVGDYVLIFQGVAGTGGLYIPLLGASVNGGQPQSASAGVHFNSLFRYQDNTGGSITYCDNFFSGCGIPFLFNVPIAVHIDAFARSGSGVFGIASAQAAFGVIQTLVDGRTSFSTPFTLVPTPEPTTFILVGLGGMILGLRRLLYR